MPLSDLPIEMQQHIWAVATHGKHVPSPNTYNLTDLLHCIRKAGFKRKLCKPLSLESAYNIFRGKIYDTKCSSCFTDNQKRVTYRCERIPHSITGLYDFITSDNPPVLTDLKTTKNVYFTNEAIFEYQKQVRLYAWNASVAHAQIIYMDFGDAEIFPVKIYSDEKPLMREIEQQAVALYIAEKNGYPPCPQYSGLCSKCEYKIECEAYSQ
ncbi:MAG: hypothetical protein FWG55_02170 [Candidatus Bathyarchaeota archaeon]|nr:hypothetical protein [Candidatus Termiticorpusculum sp.]